MEGNQFLLKKEKNLPIIKSGGSLMGTIDDKIQVVKGWIGDTAVETLRDTGCSGIVVRDVSLFSGGEGRVPLFWG